MPKTRDIWEYAAAAVEHKNVLVRMAHAPRFDSIRSAINSKGSLGSKLLKLGGSVVRVGLGMIPIPALGSYLSAIETAIEGKVRSYYHNQKAQGKEGVATLHGHVKFSLKEASIADMDRYRRKVEESALEANAALARFNSSMSLGLANTCDRYTEVAMAIAQAERRLQKFDEQALQVLGLMEACVQWSAAFHKGVRKAKLEVTESLNDLVSIELSERRRVAAHTMMRPGQINPTHDLDASHAKCGDFCINRDNALASTSVHLERLITGFKIATDPITPEGALAYTRSSFSKTSNEDWVKQYTG